MPVGISFGSATSGAGFDVATTVSSIMALERTPETAWATRTAALQAQDTALTAIGSSVSLLSTALQSLTSFDGVFAAKQGASSNIAAVALNSVGAAAQTSSHSLTVQQLATTAQQYSTAVGDSLTLSGTLTLKTAGASTATTLQIASGTTLTSLATQINQSGAGIRASILSGRNGQYLSLVSQDSGSAGDLEITSNAQDSSGNPLQFSVAQSGADAAYTLDGVSLTSASNNVTSAIEGVSFTLTGTSSTNVTLQIAPDLDSIATGLQTFVAAYNALSTSLTAQEGKDSSGAAEPLYGSTVVSEIQAGLSAAFANVPGSSDSGLSFAALGLSLSTTGTLSLDTSALRATLSTNFDSVSRSFLASGSVGQGLSTALTNAGATGTGTVALALSNNASEESTLADNKAALEARLATYQSSLTAELNTANQILQAIPQQLNEVNQIFYSISGYKST